MNTINRFIYVLIAFALFVAVLLFSLDSLVGAVGLRSIYRPLGASVGVMSLILIPFAIRYEKMTVSGRLIYLTIVAIIGLVAATPLSFILIVVGWFTGLVTGAVFISATNIMMIFGIILIILFLLSLRYTQTKSMIQAMIILLLLYSSGYFIGIGATPAYAEAEIPDRLVYNGKQYFLYLHWGWLGDPDTLLLYECNSIGINCEIIYRAPGGYYRNRDLSIAIDSKTQKVGASIDGQFSPLELTADDVQFLCKFFSASANDPFCTNPMNADFSGFWYMIRNKERTVTYNGILAYFDADERKKCLASEQDLPADSKIYSCTLSFPNKSFYLELRLGRNSYSDDFWTDVKLTNEKKT